jgi:thiol-disulfide isomerase/thioredoxin
MTRATLRAAATLAAMTVLVVACSAPASTSVPSQSQAASVAPASDEPMVSHDEMMSPEESTGSAALDSDPLHALTLTDVRTGEEFTIGSLAADEPVLLETMAIWCTNCRSQQHNVVDAHDLAAFHSISLDVDPSELPNDLVSYAEREGFDWAFANANAELVSQLRDRFGTAVAVPPSMPKILFRTDGSVELIGLGELLSPQQVADAVSS